MVKLILTMHLIGVAATLFCGLTAIVQIALKKGNASISRNAAIILAVYQTATGALLIVFAPGASLQAVCVKGLGMIIGLAVLQTSLEYRLKPATETPTVVN